MKLGDFSALCRLMMRYFKLLSVGDVRKIVELEVTGLDDVLAFLSGYDVARCVYGNVKLGMGLSIDDLFNELSMCWINELFDVLRTASPDLIKFVKTYLAKYAISALVRSIKYLQVGGVSKPRCVFECLEDGLRNVNEVFDVINVVRGCKEFESSVITSVLYRYADHKLEEVDLDLLEMELNERYWNCLVSESLKLKDSINLGRVIRILKDFHMFDTAFKRKSVSGEDVGDLFKRYDYSVYRPIIKSLNAGLYDYIGYVFKYFYTTSILKYSPLSYDVVLLYMLGKEWEATFLSYLIYSFTNGLEPAYVKKSLGVLVDAYGSYH